VYVCLCLAISDRAIRAAVAGGARTLESLGEVSDAGTVCGGCIEELERLLRERSNGNDAGAPTTVQPT
jgi:bacterioferritin-associated ferredoxin